MRTRRNGFHSATMMAMVAVVTLAFSGYALANLNGPPNGYANNPPDYNNCIYCHMGKPLNGGGGTLSMNLPNSYAPDHTYTITVSMDDPIRQVWGFELAVLSNNFNLGGTLSPMDGLVMIEGSRPTFAKQTAEGSLVNRWDIAWTAPSTGLEGVIFFVAALGGNGNGNVFSDWVYTETFSVSEGAAGIVLSPYQSPQTYNVLAAYPNPFNPNVTLTLNSLPPGDVTVHILNSSGQMVRSLSLFSPGTGSVNVPLNLSDLASGHYFARAVYPNGTSVIPIIKVK